MELSIKKVCDSKIQWSWEKGQDGNSNPCKHVRTASACNIKQPAIACNAASHGTCPNKLRALINAWIQLGKTGRN